MNERTDGHEQLLLSQKRLSVDVWLEKLYGLSSFTTALKEGHLVDALKLLVQLSNEDQYVLATQEAIIDQFPIGTNNTLWGDMRSVHVRAAVQCLLIGGFIEELGIVSKISTSSKPNKFECYILKVIRQNISDDDAGQLLER